MPWTRLQRPDGVFVTRCAGLADLEVVLDTIRQLPESIFQSGELFELVIYEPDSIRTVNYEQNQMVRAEIFRHLGGLGRGAVAFVALSRTNYGAVRQFTLIMNDEPIPMEPFDDLEEAEAWIALKRSEPALRR